MFTPMYTSMFITILKEAKYEAYECYLGLPTHDYVDILLGDPYKSLPVFIDYLKKYAHRQT